MSGCASVQPVVKVGLVGPFEGANRAVGYDVIYSARLAVREINEAGGIGGYRVALVALDDSCDPQLAQEVAASLALDPAVVVVIGHWTAETTAVAAPIYAQAGLPFIAAGVPPVGEFPPTQLPAAFVAAYEAVTPFAETAGPYAGATYDAFQLIWQAMRVAAAEEGSVEKTAVLHALANLTYEGMTGLVYQDKIED
ncbi:MAG: ABC transporter substrate-binding protein [Chloroflexota bacterium]